jgi:hypothetical protein
MPKELMTIDGIPVINADSDAILVVSDDHAKRGKPLDIENCPGALACREGGMPGVKKAKLYKARLFTLKDVYIDNEKVERWIRYIVPKSLMIQEAIIDNGGRFQPGSYLLKAPTPSKRTGRQQGSDTRPAPDKSKTKRVYHETPMRVNAPTAST